MNKSTIFSKLTFILLKFSTNFGFIPVRVVDLFLLCYSIFTLIFL